MAQQLTQQQNLTQIQRLSPQQLQVVRLLELNALEIEDNVRTELQDNPALEAAETATAETPIEYDSQEGEANETATPEELQRGDYLSEDDIPAYNLYQKATPPATRAEDIPFSEAISFYELLHSQLALQELTPDEREVAEYLLGNLDDDGYLRKPLSSIIDDMAIYMGITCTEETLLSCLASLQELDPPGIAARDLRECLLIQLRRLPTSATRELAIRILQRCFDDFARKRKDLIATRLNLPQEQVEKAYEEITRLNPRPGAALGESIGKSSQTVTPDFLIEQDEDTSTLRLSLTDDRIPELRINREYQQMLAADTINATSARKEAQLFLKQKIDSAQNFINAINQRRQTLLTTMQAIIDLQRPFFVDGDDSHLRHITLRDVAERTKQDISTISRVTSSKWVQTPFGIYPLKHFFTSGITLDNGEEMTAHNIRRILKAQIAKEDKTCPLTDEQLCAILQKEGFPLARRTIAKYRDQLQIPVARLRRS